MRENELWIYNQNSRRLREYMAELRLSWNDNAAREVITRYLQPQKEEAEQFHNHLTELQEALTKANKQMLYVRDEAPEAARLSEQIAEHTKEIQAEEKTAYEHVELSVQSRARVATLFSALLKLIDQANACCVNCGGGSSGDAMAMIVGEAQKINSGNKIIDQGSAIGGQGYKKTNGGNRIIEVEDFIEENRESLGKPYYNFYAEQNVIDNDDRTIDSKGVVRLKAFNISITPKGDIFGTFSEVKKFLKATQLTGQRKPGEGTAEPHHLIPDLVALKLGIARNDGISVAMWSMNHMGGVHTIIVPESNISFDTADEVKEYYSHIYQQLGVPEWSEQVSDFVEKHRETIERHL